MQQLFLTGPGASGLAADIFTALNTRPAGFRLMPLEVNGEERGAVMHLLLPPAEPYHNDLPCRIQLSRDRCVYEPHVLNEIAAPSLSAGRGVHAPMLLDGLTQDMLRFAPFRQAVAECLARPRPVITVASPDAERALRAMLPPERQCWITVPEDAAARTLLLEELIIEASMRF